VVGNWGKNASQIKWKETAHEGVKLKKSVVNIGLENSEGVTAEIMKRNHDGRSSGKRREIIGDEDQVTKAFPIKRGIEAGLHAMDKTRKNERERRARRMERKTERESNEWW